MSAVLRRQPKRCQGIGDDIRCGGQILTGGGSQVHDPLNARQHVFRLPPSHSHIGKRLSALGGREFCFGPHLLGFVGEIFQFRARSPGNSRHIGHGGLKLRPNLYGVCRRSGQSRANSSNRGRRYFRGVGGDSSNAVQLRF